MGAEVILKDEGYFEYCCVASNVIRNVTYMSASQHIFVEELSSKFRCLI